VSALHNFLSKFLITATQMPLDKAANPLPWRLPALQQRLARFTAKLLPETKAPTAKFRRSSYERVKFSTFQLMGLPEKWRTAQSETQIPRRLACSMLL